MRSAERPWDEEGDAGNGVMVWVEEGGAGCGGDGEEEGGMSGDNGVKMLGSECTVERAGHGTVALMTIIEIIWEIILEVINLFYIILTIPWVGAIIIIPVLEIETPRHRKINQLASSVQASKPRRPDAQPTLTFPTTLPLRQKGRWGPEPKRLPWSRTPGKAPFGLESRSSRLPRLCCHGCRTALHHCALGLPTEL